MYGSVQGFRNWHQLRGNAAPADAVDADATAALMRASDYISSAYVANFARHYTDPLPGAVEPATYIAAGFELKKPGFFAATYVAGQEKVLTQVGEIQWTVVGQGSAAFSTPISTQVDALLAPYKAPHVGVMVV